MADQSIEIYEKSDEELNLRKLILPYLRYWYWLVLSVLICYTGAYLYLRYTPPTYRVNALLLIKDEKKGLGQSDFMKELELFSGNKLVENEIEILRSRSLIENVVYDLNLTVGYFNEGEIRTDELYGDIPIYVQRTELFSENETSKKSSYYVKVLDSTRFELRDTYKKNVGIYSFGKTVHNGEDSFKVFYIDSLFKQSKNITNLKFELYGRNSMIDKLQKSLSVELLNQKSTVIRVGLETPLISKGNAILNKLIEQYTLSALKDKNLEATNTLSFIDERLRRVTGELSEVESDVELYKSAKGITDLSTEGNLFLEKFKETDAKLNETEIGLKILDGLEKYLQGNHYGIAPSVLMIQDPILINLLGELNELELQKQKISKTVEGKNPILETVNSQIANVKESIKGNIESQKRNLVIAKNSTLKLGNNLETSIKSIPKKEREFLNIKRQQGIKESLYLMLLQKKEETAISFAAAVTDSRVVDKPYGDLKPIKPDKNILYVIASLIGLLIPAIILSTKESLNNTLKSKSEIERLTGLSVFGEVSKKPKGLVDNLVNLKSGNFLAEQIRILRTNLQYALASNNNSHTGKAFLLTSSISGEGKSFISLNLAQSIALLDKKVVLLELDLRKPKISEYLGISRDRGITNYIIGESNLEEIIKPSGINSNFYLLSSGSIPPNPSELLSGDAIGNLMNELRERFDYIILDTPPIGLVTDSSILAKHVDTIFYVMRYGYTPKMYLDFVKKLKIDNTFSSINIIFNGVDYQNSKEYGYGYGQGYGYGYDYSYNENSKEKDNFFKKIFLKFSKK